MAGCESESSGSLAVQMQACVQTCRTRSKAVQAGCWEEAEAREVVIKSMHVDAMKRPRQVMVTASRFNIHFP